MAKVSMQTELDVPVQQVWDLVGGFNALPDWHPAVASSQLADGGQVRTLKLAGGGQIVEKLERISDEEHVYSYSIIDSPLPVADYTATIRVKSADEGRKTIVEWWSSFNPDGAPEDDAVRVIQGIYQAGFDNLQRLFNKM